MKIIVSLTTSPKRIFNIKPVIYSILNQTVKPSKLVLNIPNIYERTNEKYEIPLWLTLEKKVHLNFCKKDYGPITKLVPTLKLISNKKYKNCYIITIDDDIRYPLNMVETYYKFLTDNPHVYAAGLSGFNFINFRIYPILTHTSVHILEAYASVIYFASIFDESFNKYLDITMYNPSCKYSDDFIISNYLGLKKITRLNLSLPNFNRTQFIESGSILKIGLENDALHKGGCKFSPTLNSERYIEVANFLESKKLLSIF